MRKLFAVILIFISISLFGCEQEKNTVESIRFFKRYSACWAVFRSGYAGGIDMVPDKFCEDNPEQEK